MKTESGNMWSDPGDGRKSLICLAGGRSSMLGCVCVCELVSPWVALNVGPGLEKAGNEEDIRGNP